MSRDYMYDSVSDTRSQPAYRRDAANLLYGNSFAGSFINFVTATGLAFGFPSTYNVAFKHYWWLSMCVIIILRLINGVWWQFSLKGTDYNGSAAIQRFATGTIFAAFGWSLYALMVFDQASTLELAAIICVLAGMTSGASNVLSASVTVAIAYAAILLIPLSIRGILSGEPTWQSLGILGLAYFAVSITSALKSSRFTKEAIILRNHKAELLSDMEREKNEVTRINNELTNAYAQLNEINSQLEARVKRRTEKIYELSALDPLTGLYSRKAFNAHLRRTLVNCEQQGLSLAVLFIDLDGFKKVNDSLGHQIGDEVLVTTARRLMDSVDIPRNLCRWGGDEFLILMVDVDEDQAIAFAEAVVARLSVSIDTLAESVSIGATIGISLYPQHGKSAEQLIQLADIAMYSQKKSLQLEAAVFSDVMLIDLKRDQRIREGLAKGLQLQQFHLVYQPIIGVQSGHTTNCEALLRWTFDGALVPPDEFISIAERYGFIRQIGAWVIQQACTDAQSWTDNGIGVSVNVSILQMLADDMEDVISDALKNSGLRPNRLHLELTETVFSSDTRTLQAKIVRIQAMGVKICIDDFGTGYSSLSQLQSLAVDIIKIDRAFVHDLNGPGKAIIQAAMHIAKALNYDVIAEGIETEEQVKEIKFMGIPNIQGFYFAKPMDIETLQQWFVDSRATAIEINPEIALI
jgi:diguanylate cyclase (GGDEF)-like protein